eukprot:CAMPEP_0202792304 /NCGR_PEP_ID=MMETSP1388-20130828/83405_1 /ASSEMBLY_ACC=CAM_ASM_000864 /TAXON_ID=37098 /ORGANISM="Isochrysis sp, Strain CCMP1244" /LENGTH=39 /DNA_ID= /DNA_START= /DNA_END= /DNA_ORIENTATION=
MVGLRLCAGCAGRLTDLGSTRTAMAAVARLAAATAAVVC